MDNLSVVINKEVKPVLINKLGIALATLIILQNSKKSNIMVADIDVIGFKKLITDIINDKRVSSVYTKKQLSTLKNKWLNFAKQYE